MSSKAASQYRTLLYVFAFAGIMLFYLAYKGSQGLFTASMGVTLAVLGIVCFITGAWYGWRGAQIRLQEQQKRADAVALITLAAFLKDRSEEELQATVLKGGDAGKAAAAVLERRRTGLTRSSQQIPVPPEGN